MTFGFKNIESEKVYNVCENLIRKKIIIVKVSHVKLASRRFIKNLSKYNP